MDSSVGYPESSMEHDDAPIPCKGCGEVRTAPASLAIVGYAFSCVSGPNADVYVCVQILEEGKAFELGTYLKVVPMPESIC